ncbi:response regulator [Poseidonibacter antarcticus]|uniref:response regulator n=1 Tax=Poseidonibacter antarcticus TaxID=2478538 RepID=UPI000EF52FE3|nr:response regulator [Poseidonibacter antarcticus]
MNKKLLIHNNNVSKIDTYDVNLKFSKIKNILNEIKEKEFDIIYIKDRLTTNYMEFTGLLLAYHIRLSTELGYKKFVPIVIISDLDGFTLNKITSFAKILFTKSIFVNNLPSKYMKLNNTNFKNEFLDKIIIERPKDTSGNHDIANKWSIYKWSNLLSIESDVINKNKNQIENTLYFKYLKVLNNNKVHENIEILSATKEGKVLLIDDEWNKGWADVLTSITKSESINFDYFDYDFKDKTKFNLLMQIQKKVVSFNPDVVILDLRLAQGDHETENIDDYTGIRILQKIHQINAGIQVIMLTATSKSTILERLYEKKILGYIKKEHPDDKNIDTIENINKLVSLIDKGLDRKYLKSIYDITVNIKMILDEDIFNKYNISIEKYESFWIKLEKETQNIFDILDNNSQNKFIYAMVSIASSLETILSIFINEKEMTFWDKEPYDCQYNALRCRIVKLFEKFGTKDNLDMKKLIDKRNDYLHSRRNILVTDKEIVKWFKKLEKMIQIIDNPPKIRTYNVTNVLENLQNMFNHK